MGPASLQPSEFVKLALVIALARHLHRQIGDRPLPLRSVFVSAGLLAPPAVLILRQPDLGTVVVLALSTAALLLASGLRLRLVLVLAAVAGADGAARVESSQALPAAAGGEFH